jgi:hypothetical protein
MYAYNVLRARIKGDSDLTRSKSDEPGIATGRYGFSDGR